MTTHNGSRRKGTTAQGQMLFEWLIRRIKDDKQDLIDKLKDKLYFCPNGCIEWTGPRLRSGYGVVSYWVGVESLRAKGIVAKRGTARNFLAHHLFWTLYHCEKVDPKMEIDHLCNNAWCVNPEHMEEVTREENIARRTVRAKEKTGDAGDDIPF